MSDFYIVLPSNENSAYAHQNKPSHYVTELNQPIVLDGEWEVGLSEIDYDYVRKDVDVIELFFDIYQIEGYKSVNGRESDVYKNEKTTTPYNFAKSMRLSDKYSVKIPISTEGILTIVDKFNEKYSNLPYSKCMKLEYGLVYTRITTTGVEYPENSDIWNFVVPRGDDNWNKIFSFDWNRLKDWRFYVDNYEDTFESFTPSQVKDFVEKTGTQIISTEAKYQQRVFIFENKDFQDDPRKRVNPNSTYQLYSIANSATNFGAKEVKGFQPSLFLHEKQSKRDKYAKDFTPTEYNPATMNPIKSLKDWLRPKPLYLKRINWNISDSTDIFIVYTDIIEPSFIGNTEASLLRVIPFNKYKSTPVHNHKEFSPIFYKRVCKSMINSISIVVADGVGQFVKFNNRVQVVLHFRRING